MNRAMFTFIGSLAICLSMTSLWIILWIRPDNSGVTVGWCSSRPTLMGVWAARSNGEWQPRMGLLWRPMSRADFPERPAYFFYHWGGHLDIWLDASGKSFWYLVVPFWIPQSAAVLLTMLALRPVLHHRRLMYRVRRGLCRHCGYDLRATPDCCPECGTVS
jgi:hypothetical protein